MRRLLRYFLSVLLILFVSAQLCAQVRRAVVIGIGQYEDEEWSVIHGDRDVAIVKQMLDESGYDDIQTLVNSQATKAAIVCQFKRLANKCNVGDMVYIHFSGHGQRMTDLNGDEDDGWDEAWIPYGAKLKYSSNYKGEKHLSDDEIGYWMTKIRQKVGNKGEILLVVDACHSGDSSRGMDSICVRGVFNDFVIPNSKPKTKVSKIKEDWLTLSACKSYQLNSELPSRYGRLSYALFSNRDKLRTLSNSELINLIKEYMETTRTSGMRPQSPILTGAINTYQFKKVF